MAGFDLVGVATEHESSLALELGILSREVREDRVRLGERSVARLAGKRAALELQ